ncbi:deoxyuridine 5'-triphosphate nucleotidohydrolase-like [Rattus norvegicus]|uniref:deoxyuridine 5'-triphosphate nucleotidohydrolase-like n=1 Tax=Rattus norvegicus TaxID=10116 RepID=UPI002FD81DD2
MSSDSELSDNDLVDLEAEAARYEKEIYHPDWPHVYAMQEQAKELDEKAIIPMAPPAPPYNFQCQRMVKPAGGLQIVPGVIDPDYLGTVKVLVTSPQGITAISPGDRIAQLLLLPSLHRHFPAENRVRGDGGLGSTGSRFAFISLEPGNAGLGNGVEPKEWPNKTSPT